MSSIVLIFAILTMQRNEVYKDEVSIWKDTIQKSPYKTRPYINLAAAYINQGQYQKALDYLKQALKLGANDYKTYFDLAEVYALMERWDQSMPIYEKMLQSNPTSAVYNNLGVIYEKKGDLDKAEQYFLKAMDFPNSFQEVKLNLARVYWRKGKFNEAIKMYLIVLSDHPHENKAKYALAKLYLKINAISKAQAMARRILASQDNDPAELMMISSAFEQKGRLAIAKDLLNKALSTGH